MIRYGRQKKMIVLKRTGSPYFEEAYFILRDGEECAVATGDDMAAEAERIISRMNSERRSESIKNAPAEGKTRLDRALWFLSGATCGIGLTFVIQLIFH